MDPDDVAFLQQMIEHHKSALGMAEKYLKRTSPRTRRAVVADLARDIITAQTAEIAKMQTWLRDAGQRAPKAAAGHKM